jgi:hypothetical protein
MSGLPGNPWLILPPNFNEARNTQDDAAQRVADQRANAARFCTATVVQNTTGSGEIRTTAAVLFPVTFAEEPTFAYGSGIAKGAGAHNPTGSAQVRAWARDSRGFYLGAFMTYKVDADGSAGSLQMLHHLSFSGVAFKDLPNEMLSALETFAPRKPWMGFD